MLSHSLHSVLRIENGLALELLHLVDDEIANGELLHCHELLLLQLMLLMLLLQLVLLMLLLLQVLLELLELMLLVLLLMLALPLIPAPLNS